MLANITWTDYIIAVVLVLVTYYAFIATRYYSGSIRAVLSGKQKLSFSSRSNSLPAQEHLNGRELYQNDNLPISEQPDDEFAEVEQLIERLKSVIADAANRKADSQEFRKYLHLILKEYQTIKKSALRSSINELITSECEKYTVAALSEDEVDLLWDEAV